MSLVNDDLNKWQFSEQVCFRVAYRASSGQYHIILHDLIPLCNLASQGDVIVEQGTLLNILCTALHLFIIVDEGSQLGQLIKQSLPSREMLISGNDQAITVLESPFADIAHV